LLYDFRIVFANMGVHKLKVRLLLFLVSITTNFDFGTDFIFGIPDVPNASFVVLLVDDSNIV
jgi:hypothetical protein